MFSFFVVSTVHNGRYGAQEREKIQRIDPDRLLIKRFECVNCLNEECEFRVVQGRTRVRSENGEILLVHLAKPAD